jgi:hypothetical protein
MNHQLRKSRDAIYFEGGMPVFQQGHPMCEGRERDYEGNLIERTKREHPYNFSDYVRWAKYRNRKGSDFALQEGQSHQSAFSDRMSGWDRDHFEKCFAEHLPIGSGGFRHGNPGAIENFLRAYQRDENLELLRIVDGCNSSTGYEIFRFDFIYNAQKPSRDTHSQEAKGD